jgi:hypothetical protein
MKNNTVKHLLAMLLAGASALSCTLYEPLISQADRKTVFGSEAGIKSYSYSLYSELPSMDDVFYQESSHVDYCAAHSYWDFYVNGTYNPEQTTSWSWSGLRRINYFLDALQSEDCTVDEAVREHYLALGKWFRAYFYFSKLRSYGEVPWFEHVVSSTDEATMYKGRDPRDVIVDNMIKDLDYCYDHLQTTSSVGNSLVSKYAALLLKARICLYEASWKKYHHLPDNLYTAEELYRLAANACDIIMKSGKFSLHTEAGAKGAYRSLWYSTEILTDEVILGLCSDPDYGIYNSSNWHFNGSKGNGDCMSRAFVFTYLNSNGTPFTNKENYASTLFKDEFSNRDLRLKQTVRYPDYDMTGSTAADVVPDIIHERAATGYHIIKFSLDDVKYNNDAKNINSMPLMRYAEVLLIYAEAKAELGEITNSDWSKTIGKLRSRAGITGGLNTLPTTLDPYMQATFYPNVTDPVIMEIRRERAIELFFEGFRTSDLDRWAEGHLIEDLPWSGVHIQGLDQAIDLRGKGKEEFYFSMKELKDIPAAHKNYYVQIYPESSTEQGLRAHPNPNGGYDLEYVYAVPRIWHADDRQYLEPIPPQIIREYAAKGYTLTQHPGW